MDRPRRTKKIPVRDASPKLSKNERHRLQCAAYRARIKSDKTKHEEVKKKNTEQKRASRLLATPEQKAAEREKARLRQTAFRERKKNGKPTLKSTCKTPSKVPQTRSEAKQADERREKNRLAQQKRRANMSSQKKRRERERNNAYMQSQRAPPPSSRSTPSTVTETPSSSGSASPLSQSTPLAARAPPSSVVSSQPPESSPSAVSRATIHRIKKRMGDQLLISIKGLIRSTAKKQSTELQSMGITYHSPTKPPTSTKSSVPDKEKRTRAKVCLSAKRFYSDKEGEIDSLYKRKKFKDAGKAENFFIDNTTQIPGKLSVSRNGPRKVLSASIRSLYLDFKEKHGALISQATFFGKWPKNVLSFTKTPFRQCLCEVCINPMLLMKALNAFCHVRVETLRDLIGLTICGMNSECMQRQCKNCGVHVMNDMVESDAWEKETEWQRWGKVLQIQG